jgi:hypothetical protein
MVNGAPEPFLMTNGAFRGLALPAGTSRTVMEYRPRALFFCMALSLVALVGTVLIGWRGDAVTKNWNAALRWTRDQN